MHNSPSFPHRSVGPPFPRTYQAGTLTSRPLRGCTGLALAGEADWTVRGYLCTALAALPAYGAGDVHLDLSRLRFIDLFCTRELLALTEHPRSARLIVHQPPDSLRRIAAIIGPPAAVEFTARPVQEPSPAREGQLRLLHRAHAARGGRRRIPVPPPWILP